MITRLGWLILGTVTLWVLLAVPARRLWGDETAVAGAIAAFLCLVPAALTFLWAAVAGRRSPERQLLVLLAGSGVCMFTALGGAVAMLQWAPQLFEQGRFWVWLLVFYLFTLAMKVSALLKGLVPAGSVAAPTEAPPSAGRAAT